MAFRATDSEILSAWETFGYIILRLCERKLKKDYSKRSSQHFGRIFKCVFVGNPS